MWPSSLFIPSVDAALTTVTRLIQYQKHRVCRSQHCCRFSPDNPLPTRHHPPMVAWLSRTLWLNQASKCWPSLPAPRTSVRLSIHEKYEGPDWQHTSHKSWCQKAHVTPNVMYPCANRSELLTGTKGTLHRWFTCSMFMPTCLLLHCMNVQLGLFFVFLFVFFVLSWGCFFGGGGVKSKTLGSRQVRVIEVKLDQTALNISQALILPPSLNSGFRWCLVEWMQCRGLIQMICRKFKFLQTLNVFSTQWGQTDENTKRTQH